MAHKMGGGKTPGGKAYDAGFSAFQQKGLISPMQLDPTAFAAAKKALTRKEKIEKDKAKRAANPDYKSTDLTEGPTFSLGEMTYKSFVSDEPGVKGKYTTVDPAGDHSTISQSQFEEAQKNLKKKG